MRIRVVLIAAALAAAALPSSATAMEVAFQDDITMLNAENDRNLALQQFSAMGGTTIRMTIEHARDGSLQDSTGFSRALPIS